MKLLLDTHLLLWVAGNSKRLPKLVRTSLADPEVKPCFSSVSIWEVVIKKSIGRKDFQVDPTLLRRGLLDNGYLEIAITSAHALAVAALPDIHRDPFDRLLVAQAQVEGIVLWTCDSLVAQYPGPVRLV